MAKGIIYVLSNEAFKEGYYKIGCCGEDGLEKRLKDLNKTNVPLPFTCEYAKEVEDYKKVEKNLHLIFASERRNNSREFFSTTPERVKAALDFIPGEEITALVERRIDRTLVPNDRAAVNRARRQNLNFLAMGIPLGSNLDFFSSRGPHANEALTAKVVSQNKVQWKERIETLSRLTHMLLNLRDEQTVRGTAYWKYKGEPLVDIYNRTIGQLTDGAAEDEV